jgi:hypothetical protein
MSDPNELENASGMEPAAPQAPAPKTAGLARPARPLRAPGSAPPRAAPSPKGGAKGSKGKGILVLAIILLVAGLSVAIVIRLIPRLFPKTGTTIVVTEKIDQIMDKAKGASKDIYRVESQVWIKGSDISAADAVAIQKSLNELETCEGDLKELFDILHEKKQEESGDWQSLIKSTLLVKLWILDAGDLLDLKGKAPDYGGLYIPMYQAIDGIRKCQKEMGEIETLSGEIVDRKNPAELEKYRKRLKEIEELLTVLGEKLRSLDGYVTKGLLLDEHSPKVIKELEDLREEANKADMARGALRQLRSKFRE